MAARATRELGGEVDSISVAAAGRDLDPPSGTELPLRGADPDRRDHDAADGADRTARPRARAAAAGPDVDFGDPIGEAETIFTLHSEVLTFGRQLRLPPTCTFALSLAPSVLDAVKELAGASEERVAAAARCRVAPSAEHSLRACGRGRSADAAVRARSVTPPHAEWGAGRRHRLDRRSAPRPRSACSPGARSRPRGAAAGALRRSRRDVRRARDPRGALRVPLRAALRRALGAAGGGRMKVGVPTEIKEDEYRVALTPAGARELAEHGHQVLLQEGAGEGSCDRRRRLRAHRERGSSRTPRPSSRRPRWC